MKPNHETIYLVPTDYDGGQLTYSWCDCPAPGEGMREEDATRYVRADLVPASNEVLANRIVELTNERDALAEQVEQLLRDLEQSQAFANGYADRIIDETQRADLAAIKSQQLTAQVEQLRNASYAAVMFIKNGVALGFIRMPDNDVPDPAHRTLPNLCAALDATPAQCLAEHDAVVGRQAFIAGVNATGQGYNGELGLSDDEIIDLAELYVSRKIRQQAKGGG